MKHHIIPALAVLLMACIFIFVITEHERGGAASATQPELQREEPHEETLPFHLQEKTLAIEGYEGTAKILIMEDLHLIAEDDPQVDASKKEEVNARRSVYASSYGPAEEYWKMLAPALDGYGADLIIFCGDMIDYCSEKNIRILREGLEKVRTPWIYVRADHDNAVWYTRDAMHKKDAQVLHDSIGGNEEIIAEEVSGIRILGWNASTSQMSETAADILIRQLDEAKAAGCPVIFASHVPLYTEMEEDLASASKSAWNDRALLWGSGLYYEPDENTARALKAVFSPDSPVRAVIAGHLHFEHEGHLTDGITQYVFEPSYQDRITLLTIA